jgi:hypothetical protein
MKKQLPRIFFCGVSKTFDCLSFDILKHKLVAYLIYLLELNWLIYTLKILIIFN